MCLWQIAAVEAVTDVLEMLLLIAMAICLNTSPAISGQSQSPANWHLHLSRQPSLLGERFDALEKQI